MGRGGKGKGGWWLTREAFTFPYLKNYRKGLTHQLSRCRNELAAATARGDDAAAQEAQHRLQWIFDKHWMLDVSHEMVTDMPSWQNGRELPYGSLQNDARRRLTADEIRWNYDLIAAEAEAARASSAAATASGATQAAATVPTLGAAGAMTPATPGAPSSPSWTSPVSSASPTSPAGPMPPPGLTLIQEVPQAGSPRGSNDTPDGAATVKYKARPVQQSGCASKRSNEGGPEEGTTKSKAKPTCPPWRTAHPPMPPTGPPPPRRERLLPRPPSYPPPRTVIKEVDDADGDARERDRRAHMEAEREWHAHAASSTRGTAAHRAATAKSSSEEMKRRKHQREAAAAAARKPGAATAHLIFANSCPKHIALLEGEEAAEVMRTKPTRLPDLILQSPHEAVPSFHEDWTVVEGSGRDPEKYAQELKLRDQRNKMIREFLQDGRSVFYKSSGSSMWPLVQSHDGCTFHPIQAVTAMDGRHAVIKEASEIGVGDIVFCQVQTSQQYYAHIVLKTEQDLHAKETKYWIGNLEQRVNGWCYREHIYGILVGVQVDYEDRYYFRPHPKKVYEDVKWYVEKYRWSRHAQSLCEPDWRQWEETF